MCEGGRSGAGKGCPQQSGGAALRSVGAPAWLNGIKEKSPLCRDGFLS